MVRKLIFLHVIVILSLFGCREKNVYENVSYIVIQKQVFTPVGDTSKTNGEQPKELKIINRSSIEQFMTAIEKREKVYFAKFVKTYKFQIIFNDSTRDEYIGCAKFIKNDEATYIIDENIEDIIEECQHN